MSSIRTLAIYLILTLTLIASSSSGQIVVTHFNAAWNDPNKVSYIGELTDCDIVYVDIAASPKLQKKHNIVVVPTVIIFSDGVEVKRFQANIMMELSASKEEVQEAIDDILMSSF